jgi:hypothetical protein
MHGMELRLNELKARQHAMMLEAERDRLLNLVRAERPAWSLSSLLRRAPKLKVAKA